MVFRFDRRYYLFFIIVGFLFGLGPAIILVVNWNIMEVWPSRVPTACFIALAALIVRQGLVYYRRNPPIIEVRDDGVILHADCNGRALSNFDGAFLPWRLVDEMGLTQASVDVFAENRQMVVWAARVRLNESVDGTHLGRLLDRDRGRGIPGSFTTVESDYRLVSVQGLDAPHADVYAALESSWRAWRRTEGPESVMTAAAPEAAS